MTQADHVSQDVKTCLKVFPILAALILITVFVHQAKLPYKIQLIIEIIKAFIAVGYFVHLMANRRDISATWILTIIFVLGLLFLPIANAVNHIHGTIDTSKAIEQENLTEPAAAAPHGDEHKGEEGSVH
jgi:cytochrome c oxidase subunit IV